MKNNYAKTLNSAHKCGVKNGMVTMQMITLLACYNVLPDYTDASMHDVLTAIEDEMRRIWVDEMKEGAEDASDRIVGHVIQIRAKEGMVPL